MKKEDVFYGIEGEEILSCTRVDDVVEMFLDGRNPAPKKMYVYKFKRSKIDRGCIPTSLDFVNDIIDAIDETYGDPDGHNETVCDFSKMVESMEKTLNVIIDGYVPWTCDPVEKIEVDCVKWVNENAKEWLNQGLIFKE